MKYRCGIQLRPWFFGFTLWRFSVFVAWKSDATWRNYAEELGVSATNRSGE